MGFRFLPCLFNELVDFIEVETAWNHIIWSSEAREKYDPPFWRKHFFRWRTWRCPDAGIEYLEWSSNLTFVDKKGQEMPTDQALVSKELLDLYHWWTQERPTRLDPHDVSGWSEYCQNRKDPWMGIEDNESPAERRKVKKMLSAIDRMERQFDQEDEQMMIRLIKVRHGLWT